MNTLFSNRFLHGNVVDPNLRIWINQLAISPHDSQFFSKTHHVESDIFGSLPHIKKRLTREEARTRSTESRKNSAREWEKERKKNNLWVV